MCTKKHFSLYNDFFSLLSTMNVNNRIFSSLNTQENRCDSNINKDTKIMYRRARGFEVVKIEG